MPGYGYLVALARPPLQPDPAAITSTPAGLSAVVTHDRGTTWPDARGLALAAATLEQGGGAVFAFAQLADALACHKRLTAEAGR
ncbi:hypothetical protein [Roseomonas sp. BN140053]|uniref:hypothetical protein n=1 Tax=Roseomonas sp. BN140053 TaxID=3391898 RepID=UPI0039EBD720